MEDDMSEMLEQETSAHEHADEVVWADPSMCLEIAERVAIDYAEALEILAE